MSTDEFLVLVSSNIWNYVLILLLVFMVFIPLFKILVNSIFDPFFLSLVMTVFAYTVPFFLYKEGECPGKHLIYFVLSEFVFWVFFVFTSIKPTNFRESFVVSELSYAKILFNQANSLDTNKCSKHARYCYKPI